MNQNRFLIDATKPLSASSSEFLSPPSVFASVDDLASPPRSNSARRLASGPLLPAIDEACEFAVDPIRFAPHSPHSVAFGPTSASHS